MAEAAAAWQQQPPHVGSSSLPSVQAQGIRIGPPVDEAEALVALVADDDVAVPVDGQVGWEVELPLGIVRGAVVT